MVEENRLDGKAGAAVVHQTAGEKREANHSRRRLHALRHNRQRRQHLSPSTDDGSVREPSNNRFQWKSQPSDSMTLEDFFTFRFHFLLLLRSA